MTLLFDKKLDYLPTVNDIILDDIIKEITHHIEQNRATKRGIDKKTRHNEYLVTSSLINSLYLGYYSIPSSSIALSLRAKHYSKKKYGYKNIKKVIDALKDKNFIKIKLGSEYAKKVTRISPSNILITKFKRIGFKWRHYTYDSNTEIIIFRDKIKSKKITLPTPKSKQITKHRNNLNRINRELTTHCIALDLDDNALAEVEKELIENSQKDKEYRFWKEHIHYSLNFSLVSLRRIFTNNNIKLGARFYGGWWQSLPSKFRPHITIDGYKTSEVDFSTMSLRLLYAKENIVVPDARDLYDIGLKGSKPYLKRARELIKKFTNAIINDEKGHFRLSSIELKELKLSHKELKTKVNNHHQPISKYFGTGIGIELMYTDSVIAEDVMLSFLKEGIIVLPIHDSFIIRTGFELSLRAQMKLSFNKIVKTKTKVTTTGSLLPEHFYSKPKKGNKDMIINGTDMWDLLVDNKDSIYTDYLSSWYNWKMNT
jgi:hypothetical protein